MKLSEFDRAPLVLIVGFGREGQSTYRFLRSRWPAKSILVIDDLTPDAAISSKDLGSQVGADAHITWHRADEDAGVLPADTIVIKSPGVPWTTPAMVRVLRAGLRVTSQLDVLFSNYPRDLAIAVTGTKGKSSTTGLIVSTCEAGGIPAIAVGNIGTPVLDIADFESPRRTLVCEVSSHQLTAINSNPSRSVLLAIYKEHLDYYGSMSAYVAAKQRVTLFQRSDDLLVYNIDNDFARATAALSLAKRIPFSRRQRLERGAWLEGGAVVACVGKSVEEIASTDSLPLRGPANIENVLAALALAAAMSLSSDAMRTGLNMYQPLPHRLAVVGRFRGIEFVDDSIATIPEATINALDACGPSVETLILGGFERSLDYGELASELVHRGVRCVLAFPPAGQRILDEIAKVSEGRTQPLMFITDDMEEAVRLAYMHTRGGATVLLSPAAASYGKFKHFAARGDEFVRCVTKAGLGAR